MKAIALLIIVPALLAQTASVSVQNLLNDPRPLTNVEIARVLEASRQALAGKTFRVSFATGANGLEVLMGPEGRPRLLRTSGGIIGGFVSGTASGQPGGTTVARSETDEFSGRMRRVDDDGAVGSRLATLGNCPVEVMVENPDAERKNELHGNLQSIWDVISVRAMGQDDPAADALIR